MTTRSELEAPRRALILAGCSLLALAAGCTEPGRSNVRMHISAASSVSGLTAVEVSAKQGTATVKQPTVFGWSNGAAIDIGLLIPASIKGEIQIFAIGLAGDARVAHAEAQVTVTPGQATAQVLALELVPIPGNTGDGGAGSGGSPGTDAGTDGRTDTGGGTGVGGSGAGGRGAGDAGVGGGGAGTGGSGAGGSGAGGSGTGGRVDAGTDTPVAARAWQTAIKAENNIDEIDLRPAVAMDASGNAIAVWEHGSQIWFNRYSAATGTWGTEAPVVVAGGQGVSVGIDSQGVATVTWQGTGGATDQGIWAVTSAAGGGWATPVHLSSANAADVHLAVSASGTAIAVWTENNNVSPLGNEYILWASRRLPGGAWLTKTMLKYATDTGDRTPTAALDPAGNGFVIWEQRPAPPDPPGDSTNSVWISRFAGGVFGTPMTIETYTAGDADSGHIALNAAGNAVASWRQLTSTAFELWTRTYENSTWGTPTLITSSTSISYYQVPEVAIDGAGNAVVVWSQVVASGAYDARISRHRVGQAMWDAPMPLETDNLSQNRIGVDDVSPEVRMDGAGNAVVIWRKTGANGLANLWSRRLDATGVLGAATRIDNQNLTSVYAHALAVGANGMAAAVWYHGGNPDGGASELDIWASVFR